MSVVIKINNISKQYRLGAVSTGSLAHDINRAWHRVRGKEDPYVKIGDENDRTKKGGEYVWALKDINFDVARGDVLGIVGKNGAGKSTLLKILSRTTTPTTGSIKIRGRIASLLEVGTGFHPELSGRENIFLNGAILGMTRREIKSKFDEIVDFAGVDKYIDTPVKRYSSGMYVRLAFGVAAHLEPEILIVDEVLAVGDAEFQKKALGKMKDVSYKDGRTVLFVSHNMAAVKTLCTTGVLMERGKVAYAGTAIETINRYQNNENTLQRFSHEGSLDTAPGNENIRIVKFTVDAPAGGIISISTGVRFTLTFYNAKASINLDATFEIATLDDIVIVHHGALVTTNRDSKVGLYTVVGELPPNILNAGHYTFNLIFGENQRYVLFKISQFIHFEIQNEMLGSNSNILPGVIRPNISYSFKYEL